MGGLRFSGIPLILGGGDKWVKSKTVRWTPQGCLVGKYKPFGIFKKF